MQSLNSKRRLVLFGAILLTLLVIGLILSFASPSKPNTPGQHIDPFSHETVSNPPGKAPDKFGIPTDTPVYLGFDKLLNYGLGFGQLKNVQTAFYRYSHSLPKPIGQISVDVDHISTQHDPTNPSSPFDISFKVQFDENKVYQAKVEYTGLNDVRLFITDPSSNKIIYDSQTLYSSLQSD
jgi:hypothetical protein